MTATAREAASEALIRFEADKGPLRDVTEDIIRQRPTLSPRDRAFCRDLVNGTIRRLNTVDWAINKFAKIPVDQMAGPVRNILRLGAFQILYMSDRVPPYAAVNEAVLLAKNHAHAGVGSFVNAVLRALDRDKEELPWPDEKKEAVEALSLKYSHPAWLVRRWLDRWGADVARDMMAKNNETAPLSIRVNVLKENRETLFKKLVTAGVEAEISVASLDGMRLSSFPSLLDLESFRDGAFMVQDEASQIVAQILDPRPGETVLDLCAGVGGKSAHIAERMGNRGVILSFDNNARRLQLLRDNVARLGTSAVQPFLMDAREAGKKFMGSADRALVDAPCSGLGILRRRPDIRWKKSHRDLFTALPGLQLELLRSAALCLKPGGVLVYATCTNETEENEGVVNAFLKERYDIDVEKPDAFLPPTLHSAVTDEGFIHLHPHIHGTDGFFIARLRRKN